MYVKAENVHESEMQQPFGLFYMTFQDLGLIPWLSRPGKSCFKFHDCTHPAFIQRQTVRRYRGTVLLVFCCSNSRSMTPTVRTVFWILFRTIRCNFQDFQGPKSFSRTFQGLEIWPPKSSTFNDFPGIMGTLSVCSVFGLWAHTEQMDRMDRQNA